METHTPQWILNQWWSLELNETVRDDILHRLKVTEDQLFTDVGIIIQQLALNPCPECKQLNARKISIRWSQWGHFLICAKYTCKCFDHLPFKEDMILYNPHDKEVKECNSCGMPSVLSHVLKKCSRCKKVYYCSKKCQEKDWNLHKPKCCK